MKLNVIAISAGTLLSTSTFVLAGGYDAIAVGVKNGSEITYGIGAGDTSDEAIENAVKFCGEDGAKGCAVLENLTYKACGAVAINAKSRAYYYTRATRKEAEASALQNCQGDSCHILAADCVE
jgi:hypothetical protein